MSKSVAISFGRLNPPTLGHEHLVRKLLTVARGKSAKPILYLSHTQNPKKDPLSYDQKIKYAKAAFGKIVRKTTAKNIIQIAKELETEKFTDLILVVGSDRVSEFTKLLSTYNHKEFNFNSIDVVSAGERDPDAEGIMGMSASKMRSFAKAGKINDFIGGAPTSMSLATKKRMFLDVKKNLKEQEILIMNNNNLNEEFSEFITEEEMLSISPGEMEKMLSDIDVEDLDPSQDDAYLLDIIHPEATKDEKNDDEDKEDHEEMDEARVLTIPQRIKLAQRMRRLSKRMAMLKKIKAKRMAPPERLRYRARKAALMIIRKRVAGKMAGKYNTLSRQQKIQIDQMVSRRFGKKLGARVSMFSTRLLPLMRRKETARLIKARGGKSSSAAPQTAIQAGFVPYINSIKDLDLDESKMSQLHQHIKDGKTAEQIAKLMKIDVKTIKSLMDSVDLDESESVNNDFAKAFPKRSNREAKNITSADNPSTKDDPLHRAQGPYNMTDFSRKVKNYHRLYEELREFDEARKSVSVDQGDEGDSNIIYQLRKVVNLRGIYVVKWSDGTKSKMSVDTANHALAKFSKLMRTPGVSGRNKQLFIIRLGKNPASFEKTLNSLNEKLKKQPPDALRDDPPDLPPGSPYGQQIGYGMSPAAQGGTLSYEATNASVFYLDPEASPLSHAVPMTSPEVDKEDDKDPSDSDSRLTPKLDVLLRLGLVKSKDIGRYRQALRGGDKALMNPNLRKNLADIMDKLIGLATKDPAIYSRLRSVLPKSIRTNEDNENPDDKDPSDSDSRLTPKLDVLLRLGLVKSKDISKYRQALKSGDRALINVELRKKLTDIMDKLINLSIKDPAIYNRLRSVVPKSADEEAVVSPMSGKIAALKNQKADLQVQITQAQDQARRDRVRVTQNALRLKKLQSLTTKKESNEFELDESSIESLVKKSEKSGISLDSLIEVFARGYIDHINEDKESEDAKKKSAFNRVNAFIAGGETGDDDLREHPNCGTPDCCGGCDTSDLNEVGGAGDLGTDELRMKYSKDTPGQTVDLQVASFSDPKQEANVMSSRESALRHKQKKLEPEPDTSLKTVEQIKKILSGKRGV